MTPSIWLADLVKESFLRDYSITVINNGIDLSVYKPTNSDFKSLYNLESKKIVLGVAFDWSKRKGLDVFLELSKVLPEDYKIVMVGIDESIEKNIPENIIAINKTHSQEELAAIYTVADVFVNPTREENYPTVNMEALACGTPVITFKTGGSPEIIDTKTGQTVECDDINALAREIINICSENPFSKEQCLQRAKSFNRDEKFLEYIKLYEKIMFERN